MRYLNRFLFAAVVAAGSTGLSLAQQGGLGGGSPGGGLGGQGGGGLGGQGGGGLGGQGGGALGGQQLQGAPLLQQETAPQITAPGTTTGGAAGGAVDASNPFGTFYANPYYAGTWANSKAKSNPGGFGQALYGTAGGGGGLGAAGGAAGGRMGTTGGLRTGTTTGLGGRAGGLGGLNTAANQTGQVIALPAQIAYPAFPAFRSAPIAAPQLQADISGMIGRSVGTIANPAGVQVVTEGNNVMLRGAARDADEARLIEGMIRLTPGVRDVRNELTFPNPTGLPAGPMPGANSPPGYGLPSAPPVPGAAPLAPTGFAAPSPVRLPGATVGTLTPPSR